MLLPGARRFVRCSIYFLALLLLSPESRSDELQRRVGRMVLAAPENLQPELDSLAEEAREILPDLSARLGVEHGPPFTIYLIPPGRPETRALRRLNEAAPPWAAGFVFSEARVGAVRLGLANRYPYSDAKSVLAHEIVHVLLFDAAGRNLPRWFEEGVASHEALRWGWQDRWVLTTSVFTGVPPPLSRLDLAFATSPRAARTAYAVSFDFVGWAIRKHGESLVPSLLALLPEADFDQAWLEVTGEALRDSEERWRRGVTWLYRWVPVLTASSTLWVAITVLALLATWRRRVKTRELEAAWEADESVVSPHELEVVADTSGDDEDGNLVN